MAVEPLRHLAHFSPEQFGGRRVDIVGVGATGSAIAVELAKLGVKNLHVWDFDHIEEHNLANQAYGLEHVGQFKVDALAHIIKRDVNTDITIHNERVTEQNSIKGELVFLQVDSMSARKEIGKSLYFGNTNTIIETRMGAESGLIYTFSPNNPAHIKEWENTLYEDKDTEDSACGSPVVVSATAKLVAGFATWQFVKWVKNEELDNEILFSTRPVMIQSRSFPRV